MTDWRNTQQPGLKIKSAMWNEMALYIIGHASQHHSNGEQPIFHNLLSGYEPERHRKITEVPSMEILIIEV